MSVGSFDDVAMDCGRMRKGLLWQQRDKLFSRWKERYFILTRDLLQCFKRNAGKVSDMGEFLFKVSLLCWFPLRFEKNSFYPSCLMCTTTLICIYSLLYKCA